MHSAELRGTDFVITVAGARRDHRDYFQGHTRRRRVGLLAPTGVDGVAAATLIMAYVTAFYDTYRATGKAFFAYPDYFCFQSCTPAAGYAMLDIWPDHKIVGVADDPQTRLNAINDRGINVLMLPDKPPSEPAYQAAQLESARRTIETCYLYALSAPAAADVIVESQHPDLIKWAGSPFETAVLAEQAAVQEQKAAWLAQFKSSPVLRQGFRRVPLEEALARL